LDITFWKNSSTRMKRLLSIGATFLLALVITIAGTLTPISLEDATGRTQELEKLRENLDVQYIFGNNMMICLIMFIPVIGPFIGIIAMYNTGLVIAAEGIVGHMPPLLLLLALFIFPFTWMEFIAYSTGLAESVWLTWRLIQRKGLNELRKTCILIAICNLILLLAALIEMGIIEAMPKG